MNAETATYVIIATAGGAVLGAFGFLILAPAWSAYGRVWERIAATFLSFFVLAALGGAGLGAGLVIVYYWDSIIGVFGMVRALAAHVPTIS